MGLKLEKWELILLLTADVCSVRIELERLNWASWFIVDLVVSWQSRCGKQEHGGSSAFPSNHWCKSLRVGLFTERFDQVLSYQHQLKTWTWAPLTGKRANPLSLLMVPFWLDKKTAAISVPTRKVCQNLLGVTERIKEASSKSQVQAIWGK